MTENSSIHEPALISVADWLAMPEGERPLVHYQGNAVQRIVRDPAFSNKERYIITTTHGVQSGKKPDTMLFNYPDHPNEDKTVSDDQPQDAKQPAPTQFTYTLQFYATTPDGDPVIGMIHSDRFSAAFGQYNAMKDKMKDWKFGKAMPAAAAAPSGGGSSSKPTADGGTEFPCKRIKFAMSKEGGKPQMQCFVPKENKPKYATAYKAGDWDDILKKLRGVKKANGKEFAMSDLQPDEEFGGEWIVVTKTTDKGFEYISEVRNAS